jgi:hypothetical protein
VHRRPARVTERSGCLHRSWSPPRRRVRCQRECSPSEGARRVRRSAARSARRRGGAGRGAGSLRASSRTPSEPASVSICTASRAMVAALLRLVCCRRRPSRSRRGTRPIADVSRPAVGDRLVPQNRGTCYARLGRTDAAIASLDTRGFAWPGAAPSSRVSWAAILARGPWRDARPRAAAGPGST